jgi:putative exporter of polyketide antibiotics
MSDVTPPPPPPPPPGAQPPAGDPSMSKNNLGTWSLVLGIVSIVCCGLLAGIPAIILGNGSKKAQAEGLATNGNLGQVGFILGIVGTVLGTIWLIFAILNFVVNGTTTVS